MFDPVTETFVHYPIVDYRSSQSLNNALTGIVLDQKGNIWLSAWGGGVYLFDTAHKRFTLHPYWEQDKTDEEVCSHIFSLYGDQDDVLWVATAHGGLYALNEAEKDYRRYDMGNQTHAHSGSGSVRGVWQNNEGNIWIATANDGIHILDQTTGEILQIHADGRGRKNLLSDNVNYIYEDHAGTMWVGTPIGVNFYHPLLSQFSWIRKEYNTPGSLSEDHVLALLKDSRNNIWVGEMNGVDRIAPDGKATKRYQFYEGTDHTELFRFNQAICEDKSGNIWIGGYSDYLMKYDPAKDSFSQIQIPSPRGTDFSYRNVFHIYEDWDHTLWLATELGTINYDPLSGIFTPLFESGPIIYPEEKSHVVLRDQDMELWVGTEYGLRHYDRDLKLKHVYTANGDSQNSITNHFITSIYEDQDGVFWIGTMGGLHRFDKKTEQFELIKRPDRAYGDPIFGIGKDKQGNLWMSTTSGILKYDIETGLFHIYNESDGLQSNDFQLGAFFEADDGELFFGGKDGFNAFYPEKLKVNTLEPPVVITDFLLFNQPVVPEENGILTQLISETEEISIKHSQSVISFKFVALNYISSQKNRYAYMMEGFDQNWIEVGSDQRTVTYTNLNPGEYLFKVKASNNDGIWNDRATQLKITIRPPFWRTGFAYLVYTLLFLGIVYLTIRYFMVRERDRNNLQMAKIEAERIREMDEMKVNFFTNVSHEFRTPLSLILGPLTQIMEKKNYPEEDSDLYTLMYRNAQRLLRLIDQLLDFRKIEAGKLELNLKYDDVIQFIINLTGTFSFNAAEKHIRYSVVSAIPKLWMNFDPDKLDKILYNLISNAFHYTGDGGKVDVILSEVIMNEKHYLQIQVKDTGIGISPEEAEQLFTAFYQGNRQKTMRNGGSGIGLTLVKELVDLHQGTISVESAINKGTTFTVQLPVTHPQEAGAVIDYSSQEKLPAVSAEQPVAPVTADADVVLVVEDNYDMCSYIRNILSDQFNVLIARNGREGLEIATEVIPDLIVSDIMMPSMDGIEMVKALNSNEKTNHIPVILLTSRHNESQVLESYKIGVEDYITKPFSAALLHARIQNVLLSRKKLWEQYKQSGDLNEYEKKLSEDPQKQAFVKKINEVVMAHISETDFGIESLSDALKMSSNQLFRKVKALMNTTPYNVIIQIRMTHAATLMRESDHNISEIAFLVGYQELSNFSRAFKKYFRMSPREYLAKFVRN